MLSNWVFPILCNTWKLHHDNTPPMPSKHCKKQHSREKIFDWGYFPKLPTDSERGLAGDILKSSFENESTENLPYKSQCFHLSAQKWMYLKSSFVRKFEPALIRMLATALHVGRAYQSSSGRAYRLGVCFQNLITQMFLQMALIIFCLYKTRFL